MSTPPRSRLAPAAASAVRAATYPSFSPRSSARKRLAWELAIVLALSFGASGVRAIIVIIDRLTRDVALAQQTATLNATQSSRPWLDLAYQLHTIVFGLAPVALVIYLLWQRRSPHLWRLGLSRPFARGSRVRLAGGGWWGREVGFGFVLAAAIGLPGIAFYLATKALGINVTVVASALSSVWWAVPVLVMSAAVAALGEELIVVAYFFDRLRRIGIAPWLIIVSSAVLRGSYHLYQGFGGFLGNVVMGLVFGWVYHRWGRALPLVVAHWLLDIVSFVGYPLAVAWWPQLFSLA